MTIEEAIRDAQNTCRECKMLKIDECDDCYVVIAIGAMEQALQMEDDGR